MSEKLRTCPNCGVDLSTVPKDLLHCPCCGSHLFLNSQKLKTLFSEEQLVAMEKIIRHVVSEMDGEGFFDHSHNNTGEIE